MNDDKDSIAEQKDLWSAALETFCHQVLSVRRVYPKETFCSTRFLGVHCQACRHPGVVEYISETVQVATSALFEGDSNEVSLVIFDQEKNVDHEKYSLCLLQKPRASIEQLEREMRDLILSVCTLGGMHCPAWSPSITFKILLYLPTKNSKSEDLSLAIKEGKWYCPNTDSCSRAEEKRRPVHHMPKATCQFYFQTNLTRKWVKIENPPGLYSMS